MDKFKKIMLTITAVITIGIVALGIWACIEYSNADVDTISTILTNTTSTILTSTGTINNAVRIVF